MSVRNELSAWPVQEPDYSREMGRAVLPYEMDAFATSYYEHSNPDPQTNAAEAELEDMLADEKGVHDQTFRLRQLNDRRHLSDEPHALETIVEVEAVIATKSLFRVTYRPIEGLVRPEKPRHLMLSPAGRVVEDRPDQGRRHVVIPVLTAAITRREIGYFLDWPGPVTSDPAAEHEAERHPALAA